VLVVGVSDETHELIDQYVKDHKVSFPIARIDGAAGFEDSINTKGYPHAAVFAPTGEKIWDGHPAESDGPIGKAAKTSKLTPLLPAACAGAEKLMNDGKNGAACLELKKVLEGGTVQGEDEGIAKDLVAFFERSSKATWDDAEAAIAKKDWLTAFEDCTRLQAYAGLESGDKGVAKLAELRADVALMKEVDGAREGKKGAKLEDDYDFKEAIKVYKSLVSKFAGTEAAKQAQERLDVIKRDNLIKLDPNCEECVKAKKPCEKHAK
jgi:hypothetical protein